MDILLKAENLSKKYGDFSVIDDFCIEAREGESVAIVGPSGSGKSTLLHLLSGLDRLDSGVVEYPKARMEDLSNVRRYYFGFVYQFHFLIEELSVLENIMVASNGNYEEYALSLLKRFKLLDKKDAMPYMLSGGQKQRVAIIRGLINFPKILFADEPTGNLDYETSKIVQNEILDLVKEYFMTAIIATHDMEFAKKMDRIIKIENI